MRLQGALVVPLDVQLFSRRAAFTDNEYLHDTMRLYVQQTLRRGIEGKDALLYQHRQVVLASRRWGI